MWRALRSRTCRRLSKSTIRLPAGSLVHVEFEDHKGCNETKGWLRFESAEGKHLYRHIDLQQWFLRDKFDPESTLALAHVAAVDARQAAVDSLLPVGEQQWTCQNGGWVDLPLTVTLLETKAEVETEAERLREARETQLAEQKAANEVAEAACNAAREQLVDVAGVTIEGMPQAE